jgi:ElaB/YqjD/DUF883 family membrane-anchored ribosome-binding protein
MADKIETQTGDISADLTKLRQDIARLTTSVADLARDQAANASDRVQGAMADARDRIASSASDAQDRVKSATADLETSIERNPITAVLIAAIAGLLLGMMGRSR